MTQPMSDDQLAGALEGKTAGAPTPPVVRPGGSVLTDQEAASLTVHGEHIAAQVRSYAPLTSGERVTTLALNHMLRAPRSTEVGRPYVIGADDARKLRDLLNAATERGDL